MKPACVKARVVRKSRGQQCPYGFDSRPEHEGQFLKIVPFYKSLIISTLLLSGFILCYLVSHTAEGKNTFDLGKVRVGKDQHPEWTTPVSLKNPFGSPEDTKGSVKTIPVNNYNKKYE